MTEDDVEILEKKPLYRGHVALDLYSVRHKLFAGGWSGAFTREVMARGEAVGVLPFDPQRNQIVLVEQFRIGAYLAGRPPWQTEIVCGVIEDGETPEDVARREAREESGCEIGELRFIAEALSSPGLMSETVALFCGRIDSAGVGGIHGVDGENEDIRAFTLPAADIADWLASGRVTHAASVIALQWLQINGDALRREWA